MTDRLLDLKGIMEVLGCGRNYALQTAREAGARFVVNGKKHEPRILLSRLLQYFDRPEPQEKQEPPKSKRKPGRYSSDLKNLKAKDYGNSVLSKIKQSA